MQKNIIQLPMCLEEDDMNSRFMSPFTDFGFKKVFGEDANKILLIDFLNTLMEPEFPITDIIFRKNEHKAPVSDSRNSIFDIYCTDSSGQRFIVEMQNSYQTWFVDRTLYYSSFLIEEQGQVNEWNFKLMPVYCIAFVGFRLGWKLGQHTDNHRPYLHRLQLKDDYNEVGSKNLTIYLIELPKFQKREHEIESRFDKWLYFLNNLFSFEVIPDILKEPVFERAFEIAELAAYTKEERLEFERSLKSMRDNHNVLASGIEKGRQEGIKEGEHRKALETAQNMKARGYSDSDICKLCGLSAEEIAKLPNI